MKIGGKTITMKPEVLVIPIGNDQCVIQAAPVIDYTEFESKFPKPQPKMAQRPGEEMRPYTEEQSYRDALDKWFTWRNNWMILESLKATIGLEWSTIKQDDPETYGNYSEELVAAFGIAIHNRIIDLVFTACGLNQAKIDKATKDFLIGREAGLENSSSPMVEANSMPNGEPAKDYTSPRPT